MITIIIPVLNESQNLQRLLPYLHTHVANKAVEIIVVDAARSTDDIASLCQQYDIHYRKSEHTQRSIQMNEGVRHTTGDILLFLHADVLPPPNFCEEINRAIANQYQAGFFAYQFQSTRRILKINAYFTRFDGFFAGGGDQCQFVTRSIFEKLGGYDDAQIIMEDFEFYDRLKKSKVAYKIIQTPAKVSARKYECNSYLKVNLVNLIVFIGYKMGFSPHLLKRYYLKCLH